jgi:hypothetical protein
MDLSATAATPSPDAGDGVPELCARLGARARELGVPVDWDTLCVTGPVEVVDRDGGVRYEWTATVAARAVAVPDGR